MARPIVSEEISSPSGWQALVPVYGAGWGAYPAPYTPKYRKFSDGRVRLGGLVQVAVAGATSAVLTLPVGVRPVTPNGVEIYRTVMSYYAAYGNQVVYLYPDGRLLLPNYSATVGHYISLDNLDFDTAV